MDIGRRGARHRTSGGAEQPGLFGDPHWNLVRWLQGCPLFGERRQN